MQFARRLGLVLAFLLSLVALPASATPLLLVDMDTLEVLHAEDAGQPWHPASLTKLMTAFVTFEQIALGNVSLDTKVILSKNAVAEPPSKSGLPVDTALPLEDALYLLLVKSANDIAVAIAETVGGSEARFVAMMNETARRMGLTATHYVNPHGLDDPAQVTSARDVAILSLYIRQTYPQYAPIFATEEVTLGKHHYESNNELLTTFRGTTGMKTGYICSSGLNIVATVERGGRRLLAVLLGGASSRDRNERTARLLLRGFSGALPGTGRSVLTLVNQTAAEPVDMRPLICGAKAREYEAAQKAEFPYGLEGEPSYLEAEIVARTYAAVSLGRIRENVPLPRPRPFHLPVTTTQQAAIAAADLRTGLETVVSETMTSTIPFPRPRPEFQARN